MIQKLKNKIQSHIKYKIILYSAFLLIAPVCIVSSLIYRSVYSEFYANEMQAYNTAVRQTGNSVERIFDDVLSASNMMMTDDTIRDKMINLQSAAAFSDHTDVEHRFFSIQTSVLNHYMHCILIVTDRWNNCYSNESDEVVNLRVADRILAQPSAAASNSGIRWHDEEYVFPPVTSKFYLVFSRRYYDYTNANPLGNIIICINEDVLEKMIEDLRLGKNNVCSIVAPDFRVLVSTSPSLKKQQYDFTKDTDHIVNYCRLSNGWYLVSQADSASLQRILRGRMIFFILMLPLIILSFGAFIYIFSKSIIAPIIRLNLAAREVSAGNLEVRTEIGGTDELHNLSASFNRMVVSLKRLIRDTAENVKREKSLEIQMLYAQINPHFLFNTLNSIRWAADASGAPNVSRLIVALATVLRGTIIDKKECIPIREEIENIKSYIYIQQFRYPGRFQIRYEIDETLLDYLTPKFLIQPLIENSILHGFENMERPGVIAVRIRRKGGSIEFGVEDNGGGISEKIRDGLLRSDNETAGRLNRIGLPNVHQRLVLKYGPQSGLRITEPPGGGTLVVFCISAEKGEDGVV